MKNRNIVHKDDWATPSYIYDKLNIEFDFNFDPCPYQHDIEKWDGLEIEWGNNLFINFFSSKFEEWKNYNAQNVKSTNIHQILPQEIIGQEAINHNVKNVCLIEIANEIGIKEKRKKNLPKNIIWKNLVCKDVQNAKLLNHLIKLILVLTENVNLDIHQIAKNVQEKHQEKQWLNGEKIQLFQSLSRFIKLSTENQIKEEKNIMKEIELEIINIDQKFFNGQKLIGESANYTFQTDAFIVDQKNFLFKTILFLYQVMFVQERHQKTLSHLVSGAIVQKTIKTLISGQIMNQLKELKNISIRLEHKARVFINPPYSRKLKEAFVIKAIEESKKGKLCVMLLPVSTSTQLFHKYILPNQKEIRFIERRIKFFGVNTKGEFVTGKCGMHDSMVVVFDNST